MYIYIFIYHFFPVPHHHASASDPVCCKVIGQEKCAMHQVTEIFISNAQSDHASKIAS